MFNIDKANDTEKNYQNMVRVIKDVLSTETDLIANLANISSFINVYMDRLNWVGFYLLKEDTLVLGPFQGKPACVRIAMGKGVCGTSALEKKVILVPDVHSFPGHIACDGETNSEIVLPIIKNGEIFGVLDLDSPDHARFGELEEKYLTQIVNLLEKSII